MDILIIKLAAIGDVLRTTSVLKGLKEKYSKPRIDWITLKESKELLLSNPLINEIFVYDPNLYEKLKDKKYDLVINLDEDKEACRLATKLGKVVGFYIDEKQNIKPTPTAKEWFDMSALGEKPMNDVLKQKNKKTYQQIMFEIIGIQPKEQEPILNLTKQEINFGKEFAKKHNIIESDLVVGMNTGAGKRWARKKLSVEKTAELADRLTKELGAKVILFGGPEEEERNKEIKKLANKKLIDAGCRNSLREFASIINLCNVLATSDSLAMHIGIALKKQIVVFFGPTSHAEIELYGRGEKILPPLDCICCYKKECSIKPSCTDLIRVEDLFSSVKRCANK